MRESYQGIENPWICLANPWIRIDSLSWIRTSKRLIRPIQNESWFGIHFVSNCDLHFQIHVLWIRFVMQFSKGSMNSTNPTNPTNQISRFVSIWKDWCTIPTSLVSIFEWESIKHHDQSSELPGTKARSHGLVQGWPRRGRQAIFGPQGLSDGPQTN